jgi:hypothetical protein
MTLLRQGYEGQAEGGLMKCCWKCSYARQIKGELCCVKNAPAADVESGTARWPIVQQEYYCGSYQSEEDKFSLEKSLCELQIEYDIFGPFCKIALTQGKYAKVDPKDFIRLSQFRWYCNNRRHTSYAIRNRWEGKKRKKITMHREVMNTPEELVCDHINRNGLDNRKGNLRNCTQRENSLNNGAYSGSTSRYKGVYRNKGADKWATCIKGDGRKIHLGYFESEEDAGKAYDKAAKKYFGEFACLNFPKKP